MNNIIWKDSFDSLGMAIERLSKVLNEKVEDKNNYIRDASIHRFEFVIELFWKVLKKALAHEMVDSTTPRDVMSKAFQFEFIDDEAVWLQMLDDRNNLSHSYREEEAKRVFNNIKTYLLIFEKTYAILKAKYISC